MCTSGGAATCKEEGSGAAPTSGPPGALLSPPLRLKKLCQKPPLFFVCAVMLCSDLLEILILGVKRLPNVTKSVTKIPHPGIFSYFASSFLPSYPKEAATARRAPIASSPLPPLSDHRS